MTKYKYILFYLTLFLWGGALWGQTTLTTDSSDTAIEELIVEVQTQANDWFNKLEGYAADLLLSLATISLVWIFIQLTLRGADFQEFVTELVRFILTVGFYLALIINAETWAPAIIKGFVGIAQDVGGSGIVGNPIDPAQIFFDGLDLAAKIIDNGGTFSSIVYGLLGLATIVIYALIAGIVLVTVFEAIFVTSAGVLFLGFGGSVWTTDYARRYIAYVISVGAKLYITYLILGFGERAVYNWAIAQDTEEYAAIGKIIGLLILLFILIQQLPPIVQNLINGGVSGGGNINVSGIVRGGATAAGAAVLSTATAGVGSVSALGQASKLATAQTGIPGVGSTIGGLAKSALGSKSNEHGPLPKPSIGGLGIQIAQTGKNLGSAVASAVKDRGTGEAPKGENFMKSVTSNLKEKNISKDTPPDSEKGGSISKG